jgi:hypothetical protein
MLPPPLQLQGAGEGRPRPHQGTANVSRQVIAMQYKLWANAEVHAHNLASLIRVSGAKPPVPRTSMPGYSNGRLRSQIVALSY